MMMDLRQSAEPARTRTRRVRVEGEAEDLLQLLPDGKPKTVFVKDLGNSTPGFSDAKDGNYHRDGLEWKPRDTSFDLFINFVLLDGVDEIERPTDAAIYRSERFDGDITQALAVKAAKTTYEFFVIMAGGVRCDPKIIITPQ